MDGCEKIPKKTFFTFSVILLVVIIVIIILTQSHSIDPRIIPPSGIVSDYPQSQNETGIQKKVSIVSISQQPGDRILDLSGKANLTAGSAILYEIWPANISMRKKTTDEITGSAGITTCYEQNGSVVWSVNIDIGSLDKGGYIINAWPEQFDPRYGDRKMFFIPLNDTISNGAGTYFRNDFGNYKILLISLTRSTTPNTPVSVTPLLTPA
jgi:hypothetical protein